jgi:hypothetical protein
MAPPRPPQTSAADELSQLAASLTVAAASSPRRHSRRGCCSPHDPSATTGPNGCLCRGESSAAQTGRRSTRSSPNPSILAGAARSRTSARGRPEAGASSRGNGSAPVGRRLDGSISAACAGGGGFALSWTCERSSWAPTGAPAPSRQAAGSQHEWDDRADARLVLGVGVGEVPAHDPLLLPGLPPQTAA